MHLLTSISPSSRTFLARLNNTTRTTSLGFTLSVARAISLFIPISSTPSELLTEEDDTRILNYSASADMLASDFNYQEILCKLNELIVLDKKLVEEYVQRFVRLRYRLVHGGPTAHGLRPEHEVEDFFGLSDLLGDEVFETIKREREQLYSVNYDLNTLILELLG